MTTYHPLGRKPAQRRMLLKNLVTSLVLYEHIRTTQTRAKAIVPIMERMLTHAKGRSPHMAIRYLNQFLTDKNACRKMTEVLLPRFADRPSGRLRIAPLGRRVGDGASMVTVSFISSDAPKKK